MATYDLTSTTPTKLVAGDIINCPYSGAYKSITLPKGTYKLEVWGGKGTANPGYAVGTLTLSSAGNVLYLYSGGNASGTSGGWNGGGKGATGTPQYSSTTSSSVGGGGGSDIRINDTSLYARVIVAGGGGGRGSVNGSNTAGGAGGGTSGSAGTGKTGSTTAAAYGGKAGTATAGGAAGTGGAAGSFGSGGAGSASAGTIQAGAGGGGGGGWYGGGSGGDTTQSWGNASAGGGGGGSGYVYTSSTASSYPSGCLLNSEFYLTSASTTGNVTTNPSSSGGYCRITVIDVANCPFRIKTDASTWTECSSAWIKVDASTWKEVLDQIIKTSGTAWSKVSSGIPPSEPVEKTIKNLLYDVNFDSATDWTATAISNISVSNKVLSTTSSSSGSWAQVNTPLKAHLVTGHKYYARVDVQYPVPNGTIGYYAGLEVTDGSTWYLTRDSANHGGGSNYVTLSCCGSVDTHALDGITLRLVNPCRADGYNLPSLTVKWKNLLFIDLTNDFGVGNEPTESWCNENISYFTTQTATVYY